MQDFIFIQYELTYNCNASCFFCYNNKNFKRISENKNLNLSFIERILENLSSVKNLSTDIYFQLIGGEVTIIPNLEEILKLIRKKFPNFILSIVTNGLKLREFLPEYLDQIYIAIHSVKNFNYYFGVNVDFNVWKKNAEYYIKHIEEVFFDVTVFPTSESINGLKDIADLATNMGVETIFVNIFQPEGQGKERNNLIFTLSAFQRLIDIILEVKNKYNIEILFGTSTPYCLDERLISNNLKFSCGAGEWHFVISPDGNVRICNQSNKSFGSLLKEDFSKIKEKIDKLLNDIYSKFSYLPLKCRTCEFLSECKGGCRIGYEDFFRPDPILQELLKLN